MMHLESERAVLITGLRGSGKTYHADNEIVPAHETVAVWDPHKNYRVAYYPLGKVPPGAKKWGVSFPFADAREFRDAFKAFTNEALRRRPNLILVDEIPLLVTQRYSAEDTLVLLATQSRHAGAALCLLSQRAFAVPLTVRTQCSDYISFQQIHAHDIRAIENDTLRESLACGADAESACATKGKPCLRHLKRGEFFAAKIR